MVRPKAEDIDKQLQRQEIDSDGSESASGSNPVPGEDITADVDAMVEEVIGNKPEEETDGFNIGHAVNEDENAIRDKEINDYEDEDDESPETELEQVERKEKVTEDTAADPYDTFGEDDDADEPEE